MIDVPNYVVWDDNDIVGGKFTLEILRRNLHVETTEHWGTDIDSLPDLDTCFYVECKDNIVHAIFEYSENVIASVILRKASADIYITVASNDHESAAVIIDKWKTIANTTPPADDLTVKMDFWTLADRGPQKLTRSIDVPEWKSILPNYSSKTHTSLDSLFNPEFKPAHGGQLILWHGKPGTGKTYALRSLAYYWRKWCHFEYIVDPEQFFGARASYLLSVLMDSSGGGWSPFDEDGEDSPELWRCLIFEDTGELLSHDASDRSGQGLSRLLNVVDGLIGQGLRVMILITTNEELHSLHPAVSRPGRAAKTALFEPLTNAEAKEWAKVNNLYVPLPNKQYTVAELFGILEGYNLKGAAVPPGSHALGFQPPRVN